MKIILLAGGKGERLRPITNSIPKPMVLIHNKPLVEYTLDLFKSYGYVDFIFTLAYLPQAIKNYFGNGIRFGAKISYIVEDIHNPLGTAGSLGLLKNILTETFVVCSGDILRESDIAQLIKFHKTNKGVATIGIYKNTKKDPKSIIKLGRNGRVREFIERPKTLPKGEVWSNASLYVLEPEVINYVFSNKTCDFGKDVFPEMIKKGEKIFGLEQKGYFLDVGTPAKLEQATMDLQTGVLHYEN